MSRISKQSQTELSEIQQRGALLVAAGQTDRQAAEMLNITESTVSRWRQEPAFTAAVNAALQDAHEVARLARCYSDPQIMQDRWVESLFGGLRDGFFLDIGASDGIGGNNTMKLESQYG